MSTLRRCFERKWTPANRLLSPSAPCSTMPSHALSRKPKTRTPEVFSGSLQQLPMIFELHSVCMFFFLSLSLSLYAFYSTYLQHSKNKQTVLPPAFACNTFFLSHSLLLKLLAFSHPMKICKKVPDGCNGELNGGCEGWRDNSLLAWCV